MLISGWRSLVCCHVFLLFSSSLTIRMWHALYMFIWDYCMKNSKIIVWDLAYKFFREEDDAHKTYHWGHPLIYHIGASAVVSNPSKNNVRSFWFKDFSRGRDGASELTILETSRRNFTRPHHFGDGRTTRPMKILREFFLFWILNPAQIVQKTYNWNIPMACCWWNQLPSCGAAPLRPGIWVPVCTSFFTDVLRSRWEHFTGTVPQIADIILTYHNSNLLVIARRLPSYASFVASSILDFLLRDVKFVREPGAGNFDFMSVRVLYCTDSCRFSRVIGCTLMTTIVYTRRKDFILARPFASRALRPTVLLLRVGPVLYYWKNFLSFPDTGLISGQTIISYQGLPRANHPS